MTIRIQLHHLNSAQLTKLKSDLANQVTSHENVAASHRIDLANLKEKIARDDGTVYGLALAISRITEHQKRSAVADEEKTNGDA